MSTSKAGTSKLRYERYEMKYFIPESYIEPISEYISAYCGLDEYSAKSGDGFYAVNSLYFDTPSFLFIKNRKDDLDDRINMRIRFYGENPELPYFMEVKRKVKGYIIKRRARITDGDLDRVIYDSAYSYPMQEGSKEYSNFHYFLHLLHSHGAVPQIIIRYLRKAYFSTINDYARITFDKDLVYQVRDTLDIRLHDGTSVPYIGMNFPGGGRYVVFELKCNITVPVWFLDIIRTFNLERSAFSKYALAMQEVITLQQERPVFFARRSGLSHVMG